MKKKIICLIVLMILAVVAMCSCEFHWSNDISDKPQTAKLWFADTGFRVKSQNSKVYYIVKDGNGWLYYFNSPDGELEAVIDENGNPTKDISVFED